jgi:hypothetical protein
MDLESVLAALDQPLPRDQVKQLKGVDYVSGHYVIETANKLFGANGWSHELTLQKVEHTPASTKATKSSSCAASSASTPSGRTTMVPA